MSGEKIAEDFCGFILPFLAIARLYSYLQCWRMAKKGRMEVGGESEPLAEWGIITWNCLDNRRMEKWWRSRMTHLNGSLLGN